MCTPRKGGKTVPRLRSLMSSLMRSLRTMSNGVRAPRSWRSAMTLHAPAMWVFILSLVLVVLAVVGVFVEIPFVSMYAFWIAVLAYVVLALGNFLTQLKSA